MARYNAQNGNKDNWYGVMAKSVNGWSEMQATMTNV